jgi:hypothetical protein
MRTAGRVLLAGTDVEVSAQLALARAAEAHGLDGFWVGGPDSYATTAAAAIAAATGYIRIGVLLRLAAPGDVLRLAEDLAVLDHCSGGRAELCLDGRSGGAGWVAVARRLLTNLRSCPVDGRELAVTPGPLQPTIPALVLGPAAVPGAGAVAELDDGQAGAAVAGSPAAGDAAAGGAAADGAAADGAAAGGAAADGAADGAVAGGAAALWVGAERTASLLAGIRAALPDAGGVDDLAGAVRELRDAVARNGARDVVLTAPAGAADDDVALLATVVAPVLRAADEEAPDLLLDTLTFRRAAAAFR